MGATRERRLLKRLAAGDDLFAFRLSGGARRRQAGWDRRAAEVSAATPPEFGEFDAFVLEEAREACRRRQAMTGYAWAIDHMVPLRRGGKHAWSNLQVIPAWLNSWKRDRMVLTEPGEWVAYLPGAGPLLR